MTPSIYIDATGEVWIERRSHLFYSERWGVFVTADGRLPWPRHMATVSPRSEAQAHAETLGARGPWRPVPETRWSCPE